MTRDRPAIPKPGPQRSASGIRLRERAALLWARTRQRLARPPVAAVGPDGSERERLEEALRRSNRELRAVNESIRLIVYARSEAELLDGVCRCIVDIGGYLMAWIGYAQDDDARSVRPMAGAGRGRDYPHSIRLSWGDNEWGRGPTGLSIRGRRPEIARDIHTDPSYAPWREAAEWQGYASSISLPLLSAGGDHAGGALMVYSGHPDAFDDAEAELLAALAETLSFGIITLRDRAAGEAAQRAVAATAPRLAYMLEASPVIVYRLAVDRDRLVPMEVSENITRLLGYPPGEVITPDFWAQNLHPDDRDAALKAAADIVAGKDASHEYRFRHRDGRWVWIRDDLRVLHDDSGAVSGAVGAWSDVTARRQADEALRKLSQAVEQSPASIAITGLDARIEYVNDAFLRSTGYGRDEVIGENPRLLHSGKTPKSTYDAMWASLTAGRPWKGEFVNQRKDGSEYIERAIIAPIRDADGRPTHYLAVKDDVTDMKRMAAELDEHRRHLEALVTSRTAELAEARRRAEAANVAKSAFLANMSHEIRTPMNAIVGLTHLMRRADPTPEQCDRLAKIDASAQHLLLLINDILDLSKVEAGKLTIGHVDFSPAQLMNDAYETLRPRADEKHLALRLDIDPAVPECLVGDPLRVSQILLNLGSNAVKFTERGTVALRVGVASAEAGRVALRFDVADTGIGISDQERAHLFRAFEQADTSTTRKYGGTGLGLAISQSLAALMGGAISVDSAPGAGSVFTLTLPFERGTGRLPPAEHGAAPGTPGGSRADAEPNRPESGGGVRILLAEDDAISQEVTRELLQGEGYRVDVAANGAEALAAAACEAYDLVLMDMQMPVMDGLTATRELRLTRACAHTPIVAMTANAFDDDRERCLRAGMNDFVAKPVDPERLFLTVARWTRKPHAARPPRSAGGPATPPGAAGGGGADPAAALADIEGLDVAAGLRVVEGRQGMYEWLLDSYAKTHAGDVGTLRAHLAAGEHEHALRVAHTLKGTAATLGAFAVQAAALEVESALRDGGADARQLEAQVAALDAANRGLIGQLKARVPPAGSAAQSPAAGAAIDWRRARQVVARVDAMLAEDNVRAAPEWEAEAALLRRALGAPADEIGQHIAAFEFDRALAALRDAVKADARLS